jgi:hypothetical protein
VAGADLLKVADRLLDLPDDAPLTLDPPSLSSGQGTMRVSGRYDAQAK